MSQIRDAASNLAGRTIAIRSHEEAFTAVTSSGKDSASIVRQLQAIETETPFKHCLIFGFSGEPKAPLATVSESDVEPAAGEDFAQTFVRLTDSLWSITLEHQVRVSEWVSKSSDLKTAEHYLIRHPILARVYPATATCILSYPGFSQGNATPRESQLSYETLMRAAQVRLANILQVTFFPLPVQDSVKLILDGSNSLLRVVRHDISRQSGTIALTSDYKASGVEKVLTDFLAPNLSPALLKDLQTAVEKSLSNATIDTLVLYWTREAVFTRLKFWDIGTDMLFVWHGTSTSYRLVEAIVNLLSTAFSAPDSTHRETRRPLQWIREQPAGTILSPARIASQLGIAAQEARAEAIRAVKLELLKPVYRLKDVISLPGYQNVWTEDLPVLRRIFETDDGKTVDGSNPSNIEVSFIRVTGQI